MVRKQGSAIEPRRREEDISAIVALLPYLCQILEESSVDWSHLRGRSGAGLGGRVPRSAQVVIQYLFQVFVARDELREIGLNLRCGAQIL